MQSRYALMLLSLATACMPMEQDEPLSEDTEGNESDSDSDSDSDTEGETESESESESDTDEPPMSMCPEPTGEGTVAGHVTSETTWTVEGSPYLVQQDITIRAPLTLEPCTVVLVGADLTIQQRDAGTIVGIGTAEEPILISALDSNDPWSSIQIDNGNPIVLAHTTIEGGGDFGNIAAQYAAMIVAQALEDGTESLHFDHVTVRRSVSQGILLMDGARFSSDSTALTVTENGSYPVNLWANGLSVLPEGDYTGNATDGIFVIGGGAGAVAEDVTMHNRGVPYVIGNPAAGVQLRVTNGAVLTIEAGNELLFDQDGAIMIDYGSAEGLGQGALVAVGTADERITFTSVKPTKAAGDWYGIYFWNTPDPRNVIDYARVEYAGGVSQIGSWACMTDDVGNHDAAIRFLGGQSDPSAPNGQIVTNTEIFASAHSGIERGWIGPDIDYLATNNFEQIAQCLQSFPLPGSGGQCPDPAPCPRE